MTQRFLNTVEVLILAATLLVALYLQLILGERPCPLCLLQRFFMMGIAVSLCLNLKCGMQKRHYGLALLSAILGAFISLRQIAFHVCPGFPKFGIPFWGLNLYTWALLIFASSIAYNALLLICFKKEDKRALDGFEQFAFAALFIAICVNVGATLHECGIGPCAG